MSDYDDDRIEPRVEAFQQPRTAQTQIALDQYVVRVYDRGPPDGRTADPKLVWDSERTLAHGGVFSSASKADTFAKRMKVAYLQAMRARERVAARREHELPERLQEEYAEIADAEGKRKVQTARIKDAKDRQKEMTAETRDPAIRIEADPGGSGYKVWLKESVFNGPPALLIAAKYTKSAKEDVTGIVDQVMDETLAKKGEGPPEALEGKRKCTIKVGMIVAVDGVGPAEVHMFTQRYGAWWVEVIDKQGEVHTVPTSSCKKPNKKELAEWNNG